MNTTPNANRKHIVFYGKTNAGKSSLMNKFLGQEVAIVSKEAGTTTDPVTKAMELIPIGPILCIDTAGIEDQSTLGVLRVQKTMDQVQRTDIAIYVLSGEDAGRSVFEAFKIRLKKYCVPYLLVISQIDKLNSVQRLALKEEFPLALFVSTLKGEGIDELRDRLIDCIQSEAVDRPLIGDLLPYGAKVVLVVPIDSEAPKGRLILPQMQCIRDCLDHGIKTYVVRDTELEEALNELKHIDLVVTDSQVFAKVDEIVPKHINLTSFSMLMARQKGDMQVFLEGIEAVKNLKPGDKVLLLESCTHNTSHEDIGRVKIPKALNRYVGGALVYDFKSGQDFPGNIGDYQLVIHCGGCMLTSKTMGNRIVNCQERNIPITNYGVLLALLSQTLERSCKIFTTHHSNVHE